MRVKHASNYPRTVGFASNALGMLVDDRGDNHLSPSSRLKSSVAEVRVEEERHYELVYYHQQTDPRLFVFLLTIVKVPLPLPKTHH